MDALRRFFLERFAEPESDTAKTDGNATEDGGAQGSSQPEEAEAEGGHGTASRSAREFATADRGSNDNEDALAAGRASDPGHPSGENAETPVEFDGAKDAAMFARVEGPGNEREGSDTGLPATAPTASPRMQAGEALRGGDATRDKSSKAVVGSAQGAEDESRRVEEGVRSVERQRGADDGERAGEQETNEEGAKVDDQHGQARLDTGAAVRFERSNAAAPYASTAPAASRVAVESGVAFDGAGASNAVPYTSSPSGGEVESPSIGEGPPSIGSREPPSTSKGEPRPAGGVESSPSEVRSSPSPWTNDVDRRLYSEPESFLSDDVVGRSPDTSIRQPSAGEGTGPSDGGQPGEGPSKGRQPGEV
ncbi:hypothetical protein K523DRAFT_327315 [Schizophyllum commune Tattone D]|nr:hypothetical protein K523DRAFT_327315 [Schizophyllum commune Tattone D]